MPDTRAIRTLVVISDVHCGSTRALLPPGFETLEGQVVAQNATQRWLWECWLRANDFIAATANGDPYALIINGDLIEGVHHGTKQIISPEVADHARAAIAVLEPVAKLAAKTFVVLGTEAHTGNHEINLGKALGAQVNPETGFHAFDRLTIDVAGVRCVFRHHIPATTRRSLRGSQLALTLAEEQLEAVANGETLPQVVGCAHRHIFDWYQNDSGICVVSPPWQMLTRFGHKIVSASRTKPGVYILDWRNRANGELPELHRRLYGTPNPAAITL